MAPGTTTASLLPCRWPARGRWRPSARRWAISTSFSTAGRRWLARRRIGAGRSRARRWTWPSVRRAGPWAPRSAGSIVRYGSWCRRGWTSARGSPSTRRSSSSLTRRATGMPGGWRGSPRAGGYGCWTSRRSTTVPRSTVRLTPDCTRRSRARSRTPSSKTLLSTGRRGRRWWGRSTASASTLRSIRGPPWRSCGRGSRTAGHTGPRAPVSGRPAKEA